MPTFGVSAERPAEGPKVGLGFYGFRVSGFQGFRVLGFQGFMFLGFRV